MILVLGLGSSWVLVLGSRFLVLACVLVLGVVLGFGFWVLGLGSWVLGLGPWVLVCFCFCFWVMGLSCLVLEWFDLVLSCLVIVIVLYCRVL